MIYRRSPSDIIIIIMSLEPCVNLRTLGYRVTGVQRYLPGLLPCMPPELYSVKPSQPLQGIKGHLWEQFCLPNQLGHRLLWSPGNTGPIGVTRQVLTVHNMASLDHPEWFQRKFALWYATLLPAAYSPSPRDHYRFRFFQGTHCPPLWRGTTARSRYIERSRSAVPSSRSEESQTSTDRIRLASPYILFVGSLEPRKNLKNLLEAWRVGGFEGATLVVVGASGRMFASFNSIPKESGCSARRRMMCFQLSTPARQVLFTHLSMKDSACLHWRPWRVAVRLLSLTFPRTGKYAVERPCILIPSVRKIFRASWTRCCGLTRRHEGR